ncbi:HRDC-like protein, partial [Gorgonomyces haynaldii]
MNKTAEEDANNLLFGSEYQNTQCLLISEVQVVLQSTLLRKQTQNEPIPEILTKTLDYCTKFSKFSNKENVMQIRSLFSEQQLNQFEMAQLANFCCETSEEASTLVPSLSRMNEDQLQGLLNDLQNLRKYQ